MLTITDEELDEYIGVWENLLAHGDLPAGSITLYEEYHVERAVKYFNPWVYTIKFGEEVWELTMAQSRRVYNWMTGLRERMTA